MSGCDQGGDMDELLMILCNFRLNFRLDTTTLFAGSTDKFLLKFADKHLLQSFSNPPQL